MPRSQPGRGEPVVLLLLAAEDEAGPGHHRPANNGGHGSVISSHLGEDYSVSQWPVVVKLQRGLTAEYVAERLEDLAACLRREGLPSVLEKQNGVRGSR